MAPPSQSRIVAGRYAVGLTWLPLIARGQMSSLALARAKEEKAKYFVHDGVSAAVGLAFFSKASSPAGNQQTYSLASMAAKACPQGDAVFVVHVSAAKGWWIGASVNGSPVADVFVNSVEEVEPTAQRFIDARKAPMLFGDAQLPEFHDLKLDQHLELEQLEAYAKPESAVRGAVPKLPKWTYAVAIAMVALLAYKQAVPWWEARQAALNAKHVPEVNAMAEWTAATNTWVAGIKKPMGGDMTVLRNAMYRMPAQVGGWDLHSISCVASGLWRCNAIFKRPTSMASNATNRTFENERPADWKVTWKGAAELQVAFEVAGSASTALALNTHLVPLKQYQVDTYSEFQDISKIFSKVEVSDMAPADITPPKTPDGQPIARPAELPEIFRANVAFSGPLRNLEMVELFKAPVFWREVSMVRNKAEKPGLAVSEFSSVFRGEIYAKDR